MSTTTKTSTQSPPPLKILTRVASIPLISSSLGSIDETLSSSPYTKSLYPAAKGLSTTAYKYTEPLQIRLAPLINVADEYANKAVDAVEARCPYPFKAKPVEVTDYVRERRQSATDLIQHSIDQNKGRAVSVATVVDHKFTPIVDYFEVAVNRITNPNESGSSSVDTTYQYQRALSLMRTLYGYSNEQIKQLQAHSALIRRVSETAHNVSTQATSSVTSTHNRMHQLSDTMLAELHKLQQLTASLSASFQETATAATTTVQSHVPPHIQEAFANLSHDLSTTASEFSTTISANDVPLPEKAGKLTSEARDSIIPLLGSFAKAISDVISPPKSDSTVHSEATPNGAMEHGEAQSDETGH